MGSVLSFADPDQAILRSGNTPFWQYTVLSAHSSGACQGIFPPANQVTVRAPQPKHSSRSGKLIGGAVGGAVGAVVCAVLLYIFGKRFVQQARDKTAHGRNPFAFHTSVRAVCK